LNYWDFQRQMLQSSPQGEEAWARAIREAAEAYGIRFTQMHGPGHGPDCTNLAHGTTMEVFGKRLARSVKPAAIVGIPWVVLHPTNVSRDQQESFEDALKFNIDFYRGLIPVLEQTGVGIALENMINRSTGHRHFARPEELVELIDALNHPLIGAC